MFGLSAPNAEQAKKATKVNRVTILMIIRFRFFFKGRAQSPSEPRWFSFD
jgi:hypothetical protein